MESIDIMQLLSGVDIVVMVAIGVIAFALESSKRVGDGAAVLIPLGLGALWGVVDGYGQAAAAVGSPMVVHIVKGALVNGGGASLAARLVKATLERLPGGS